MTWDETVTSVISAVDDAGPDEKQHASDLASNQLLAQSG